MRKIIACSVIACLLGGCSISETMNVMGFGVKHFKKYGKINTGVFELDMDKCWQVVQEAISDLRAEPMRGSTQKGFVVATGFDKSFRGGCVNTTQVAFFLTETAQDETEQGKDAVPGIQPASTTKVEVSSGNRLLSDFVAKKLFGMLEKAYSENAEEDTAQ